MSNFAGSIQFLNKIQVWLVLDPLIICFRCHPSLELLKELCYRVFFASIFSVHQYIHTRMSISLHLFIDLLPTRFLGRKIVTPKLDLAFFFFFNTEILGCIELVTLYVKCQDIR